jgi:hypothetical protein
MSNRRDPAVGSCRWAGLWLKCGSLKLLLLHARARNSLQCTSTDGERASPRLSGPCPKIDALGMKHGPDCPRLAIRGEPAGTAGNRVPRCTVVAACPGYNWSCYGDGQRASQRRFAFWYACCRTQRACLGNDHGEAALRRGAQDCVEHLTASSTAASRSSPASQAGEWRGAPGDGRWAGRWRDGRRRETAKGTKAARTGSAASWLTR